MGTPPRGDEGKRVTPGRSGDVALQSGTDLHKLRQHTGSGRARMRSQTSTTCNQGSSYAHNAILTGLAREPGEPQGDGVGWFATALSKARARTV